jgi:hypothetical protein
LPLGNQKKEPVPGGTPGCPDALRFLTAPGYPGSTVGALREEVIFLMELSASQQMGFGLRFAELKSSIIMWLQSYASKILIITPAKAPIFYSYLGTGAENKIYGSID